MSKYLIILLTVGAVVLCLSLFLNAPRSRSPKAIEIAEADASVAFPFQGSEDLKIYTADVAPSVLVQDGVAVYGIRLSTSEALSRTLNNVEPMVAIEHAAGVYGRVLGRSNELQLTVSEVAPCVLLEHASGTHGERLKVPQQGDGPLSTSSPLLVEHASGVLEIALEKVPELEQTFEEVNHPILVRASWISSGGKEE